jgi:uncharacterized protein (TIGR02246 family)
MRPFDPNECIALYTRLLEAWNRRSGEDFAALFDTGGSAVGFDGTEMHGREAIAAALRGVFETHATAAYVARIREVRSLGPGSALVRAVAGMAPPGASELNPAVNAIQSMVLTERDGTLWIALFQNTPAALHGRPEAADALTRELTEVLQAGRVIQVA